MTEVGQKKQKKKGTKMALSDFLADQSTGSWADEMDDLPSAPSAVGAQDNFRSGGFGDGGRGGFQSRGGFGDREESRFTPRAPVELPTRPPYTIHLGNLPFDVTEADIEDFFSASKINSIRIMKDFEDKPKGFGYVEFDSLDSLKKALENNGQNLCGRNVRVSVAEPPREREVREDRSAGEWRREAPVPPAGNRFGGSSSNDRFERSNDRGAPRGEFGSRFNNSERPPDRTDVNTWRRETPLPAAETSARPGWEKPREREHRDTSWSGGAFTSRAPPAPVTRRKLELKPRSAETPAAGAAEPAATKASPFGAARPIDNDEAIRRVEEKLKQEQQQKKEAAEKARKEKESKKEVAGDKKEKTVEEAKEAEVQA